MLLMTCRTCQGSAQWQQSGVAFCFYSKYKSCKECQTDWEACHTLLLHQARIELLEVLMLVNILALQQTSWLARMTRMKGSYWTLDEREKANAVLVTLGKMTTALKPPGIHHLFNWVPSCARRGLLHPGLQCCSPVQVATGTRNWFLPHVLRHSCCLQTLNGSLFGYLKHLYLGVLCVI